MDPAGGGQRHRLMLPQSRPRQVWCRSCSIAARATPERPGYRMYGGHVVAKAASADPDKLSILALAATGSR